VLTLLEKESFFIEEDRVEEVINLEDRDKKQEFA